MIPTTDFSAPTLLPLGDGAWTLEFGQAIDPDIHARVLGYCQALATAVQGEYLPGVVEWLPSFCSVTVYYDPTRTDGEALGQSLLALAQTSGREALNGQRWYVPVCFGGSHGPDLAEVAASQGLSEAAVIALLTGTVFKVYMLGFLPGFPYLGCVPPSLQMPRLASPRKVVPARSIAIAGAMCAAYPWESPGGWRLLGRTPVRLFSPERAERPALLAPGDEVVWQPIDADTYARLDARWATGQPDLGSLLQPVGAGGLA